MLMSTASPLFPCFVENLGHMVDELNRATGKNYALKRKSRPIEKGGGFYYIRGEGRLASLVDLVVPSIGSPIKIYAVHHGVSGDVEVRSEVKRDRYKSLVKKYIDKFFEDAGIEKLSRSVESVEVGRITELGSS